MLSEELNIGNAACHEILREDLGNRKLNARLIPHSRTEQQEKYCSAIYATLLKLQARITHSALPSSLEMKHVACSMTQKQKDEAQRGETRTHLPQRNLVPSLRKQKQCLLLLSTTEVQGIRIVPQGQNVNQGVNKGVPHSLCKSILRHRPEV